MKLFCGPETNSEEPVDMDEQSKLDGENEDTDVDDESESDEDDDDCVDDDDESAADE